MGQVMGDGHPVKKARPRLSAVQIHTESMQDPVWAQFQPGPI